MAIDVEHCSSSSDVSIDLPTAGAAYPTGVGWYSSDSRFCNDCDTHISDVNEVGIDAS